MRLDEVVPHLKMPLGEGTVGVLPFESLVFASAQAEKRIGRGMIKYVPSLSRSSEEGRDGQTLALLAAIVNWKRIVSVRTFQPSPAPHSPSPASTP